MDRKSLTVNLSGGRFSTTVNSSRFSLKTFISFFGGAMLNDISVEDFCSYSGSMDRDTIPVPQSPTNGQSEWEDGRRVWNPWF